MSFTDFTDLHLDLSAKTSYQSVIVVNFKDPQFPRRDTFYIQKLSIFFCPNCPHWWWTLTSRLSKCHKHHTLQIELSLFILSSGGAELLFDGVKKHHVTLPSQSEPCEYHLSVRLYWLDSHCVKMASRRTCSLFLQAIVHVLRITVWYCAVCVFVDKTSDM